jgi:hypothetical protein
MAAWPLAMVWMVLVEANPPSLGLTAVSALVAVSRSLWL